MLNKTLLPSVIVLLLLKIVSLNFTNFNLFGDEAQYWLWSKDIGFGYFSKPLMKSISIFAKFALSEVC